MPVRREGDQEETEQNEVPSTAGKKRKMPKELLDNLSQGDF